MFTHIETESVTETENSQSEISTDYTTRNVKSPSDRREMIPGENTDLHKRMMSTGRGNYVRFFSIYFSFKIINCF